MNDTRSASVRRNEMINQMDYILRQDDSWRNPEMIASLKKDYLDLESSIRFIKTSLVACGNDVGVECADDHFDDLKASDIVAFMEKVIEQ